MGSTTLQDGLFVANSLNLDLDDSDILTFSLYRNSLHLTMPISEDNELQARQLIELRRLKKLFGPLTARGTPPTVFLNAEVMKVNLPDREATFRVFLAVTQAFKCEPIPGKFISEEVAAVKAKPARTLRRPEYSCTSVYHLEEDEDEDLGELEEGPPDEDTTRARGALTREP